MGDCWAVKFMPHAMLAGLLGGHKPRLTCSSRLSHWREERRTCWDMTCSNYMTGRCCHRVKEEMQAWSGTVDAQQVTPANGSVSRYIGQAPRIYTPPQGRHRGPLFCSAHTNRNGSQSITRTSPFSQEIVPSPGPKSIVPPLCVTTHSFPPTIRTPLARFVTL